jgi:hypothetical protein
MVNRKKMFFYPITSVNHVTHLTVESSFSFVSKVITKSLAKQIILGT